MGVKKNVLIVRQLPGEFMVRYTFALYSVLPNSLTAKSLSSVTAVSGFRLRGGHKAMLCKASAVSASDHAPAGPTELPATSQAGAIGATAADHSQSELRKLPVPDQLPVPAAQAQLV